MGLQQILEAQYLKIDRAKQKIEDAKRQLENDEISQDRYDAVFKVHNTTILNANRRIEEAKIADTYYRDDIPEDIVERNRALSTLENTIRENCDTPLMFHGCRHIWNAIEIIKSGGIVSGADLNNGISTSYDIEGQVSVTNKDNVNVTIDEYIGLHSNREPAGALFILTPGSKNEIESAKNLIADNIDFDKDHNRLVAIITSKENINRKSDPSATKSDLVSLLEKKGLADKLHSFEDFEKNAKEIMDKAIFNREIDIAPPEVKNNARDFIECLKDGFDKDKSSIGVDAAKEILGLMKQLDARSSCMFEHSVNVAALVYERLSKDPSFTKTEVQKWTFAALIHDIGKLDTPMWIMHVNKGHKIYPELTVKIKGIEELQHPAHNQMMAHSLEGEKYLKNLPIECQAAADLHHIGEKYLKNNFQNVEEARDGWKFLYNGKLQEHLCSKYPNIDIKTRDAMQVIMTCDIIEAMRTTDRPYQSQSSWGIVNKQALSKEYDKGNIRQDFLNLGNSAEYQSFVDKTMGYNLPKDIRKIIQDKCQDREVFISTIDKVNEIKENPEKGIALMPKKGNELRIKIADELESSEWIVKNNHFEGMKESDPFADFHKMITNDIKELIFSVDKNEIRFKGIIEKPKMQDLNIDIEDDITQEE